MSVTLLAEHHLELISLKGGCTGASESTLVKMPVLEITCRGSNKLFYNSINFLDCKPETEQNVQIVSHQLAYRHAYAPSDHRLCYSLYQSHDSYECIIAACKSSGFLLVSVATL